MQACFMRKKFQFIFFQFLRERFLLFLHPSTSLCYNPEEQFKKEEKSSFSQILSNLEWAEIGNWNKLSARLSKLHFPCPREQFEKDIYFFKKLFESVEQIFFGIFDQRFSTRLLILLFTSPIELLSVFKFLRSETNIGWKPKRTRRTSVQKITFLC